MLDKYNAEEVEKKWQTYWEKNSIYKFDPKSKKPIFSIDVPPVYASAGHLHIGHALHYTQFEIIARLKRMQGFNVYFPPCFDDNGLPTEKYVEEKYKIDKNSTTKSEFRKLCIKEAKIVEEEYAERVYKRLGHCYDWSLLYTTISPEAQIISQSSFLDLVKKGECYRAEEPVIWCPHHQTALAQAEIEDIERNTKLNYIEFEKGVLIATTRPELLPACVGIFVHPKDKRHAKLVGRKIKVPIFGHKVKVMTDEKVDQEFGTGIVMVCTFGDTTDIEWWKKHKLELKNCVTKDGKLMNAGKYTGMYLNEGRKEILQDLAGKLKKQEVLKHVVGSCWRCNNPVEFIVTKQWFIKTLKHKKELIKQGGKVNWYPEFYKQRYNDWVNNLGWDWCISRQRYYGVPIPVWYCKKCGEIIYADKKQLPVDPEKQKPIGKCKCGSSEFIPEKDIFDTWMTSSMTPQIASRKYNDFKTISMRPQAHDIIRTWAFYSILKSYLHFGKIPWEDLAIGTFVLDSKGKGMHKSKGNAIWFDELIDKYKSADIIRYWVGTATFGEDLPFQEKELIAAQRFITKLWNASKFAIMTLKSVKKCKLEKIDEYFLQELSWLIVDVTKDFKSYKTGNAKRKIELFFWQMFCDNYLEIIKKRIYSKDKSAQYALYNILYNILKLFAPIVPHITEEIYQDFFKKFEKEKSIHICSWPDLKIKEDKALKKIGDKFLEVLAQVRQEKTKAQKSMKAEINLTIPDLKLLKPVLKDLQDVTNAKEIKQGKFNIQFL
ncbi:MAG: valine--tRNA ligase [archaeon]